MRRRVRITVEDRLREPPGVASGGCSVATYLLSSVHEAGDRYLFIGGQGDILWKFEVEFVEGIRS